MDNYVNRKCYFRKIKDFMKKKVILKPEKLICESLYLYGKY